MKSSLCVFQLSDAQAQSGHWQEAANEAIQQALQHQNELESAKNAIRSLQVRFFSLSFESVQFL